MKKLIDFKKYFFSNLIALSGYFALFIILVARFAWFPQALIYSSDNLDPDMSYIGAWLGLLVWSKYLCLLLLILFLLAICEYFLRKRIKWDGFKGFNIPMRLSKLHSFIFCTGIVLALMPLIFAAFVSVARFF